jgi:hypothetical protein
MLEEDPVTDVSEWWECKECGLKGCWRKIA